MDTQLLRRLLPKIGTPSYLFDLDAFAKRARLVREKFGPGTGLCFSVKANPFLLGALPDVFDRIEVCSPGELTICERTGTDPAKIIFSGVNKGAEDVERAMEDGVGTFTAESFLHAKLINESALRRGIRVPVLVRVSDGSQFGMDEADVRELIGRRAEYAGIEFAGLHYFTGTQKRKPAVIIRELDEISRFADRLYEETGFAVRRLEYGAGLAVDYFKENADELEEERLNAVSEKVREVARRFELTVEMGRFFAAPCGYYLTRVADTKTNGGIRYAVLDGGLHQLKYDGQIQGMQIPRIIHLRGQGGAEPDAIPQRGGESAAGTPALRGEETGAAGPRSWTLCGSLCTTADILARDAEFDSLREGDVLAFCRTGAYSATEGMAVFLSRDLPLIARFSEAEGLRVLRRPVKADRLNTPFGLETTF